MRVLVRCSDETLYVFYCSLKPSYNLIKIAQCGHIKYSAPIKFLYGAIVKAIPHCYSCTNAEKFPNIFEAAELMYLEKLRNISLNQPLPNILGNISEFVQTVHVHDRA